MVNNWKEHNQNASPIESETKQNHKVRASLINGKRLWVIFIFVVIAVAAVALSGMFRTSGSTTSNQNSATFPARRDNLVITVTESGSIKARNTVDVKSELEGQATIISIVPEGTYITEEDVKNGKMLVELDASNLTEQITQRQIDFSSAEASYADAKESYDIQVKQNESDITAAELKVRFAMMDFQKYLGEIVSNKFIERVNQDPNQSGSIAALLPDPNLLLNDPNLGGGASQELKRLTDNITLAKSKLKRAEDTLGWTQKLLEKQYVSKTDLQADELDRDTQKSQEEQAEISLALFKRYDFTKAVEQLLSDYKEAGRELERTHARARSRLAQADARLKSSEAQLDQRKERLEKTQKQLVACTIKAPVPGLVVYSSSSGGDMFRRMQRGLIEEGATVYERQSIIQLPNTAEMMAEISVHESSVDKVRPGQRATITIDAFPDQKFTGEVLKVALLPDAQRGFMAPDLKVYTTQVAIDGTNQSLKPGMSVKVEILVERLDNVLIVPVQVVANREGKKMCYVSASNTPEPREVRTGAFNDTFVQIVSGLTEGEQVLLNPPRVLESTGGRTVTQAKEGPRQAEEPASESMVGERAERGQSGERRPDRAQGGGEIGQRSGFGGPDDTGGTGGQGGRSGRGGRGGMAGSQNLSPEELAKLKQRWESMSPEEREKEKEKMMSQMREKSGQSGTGPAPSRVEGSIDQQKSSSRGQQKQNQPEQRQVSE
ncbi:MAG: efflux RND transporter periplasmic adaptor subunit [Sedimentisphaerales bacterium]|nr:efflux RND transporter periplasmic adaptor subunit [Sedimentisphaerales bacterium]